MSSVVKNTILMLFGSIGQKIISLAYFTFLVRMLGKNLTGDYTAVLAISTLFVVFIDLGLTNLLIRNGAQNRTDLNQSVSNIFGIKMITSIMAYVAMIIFSYTKFEAGFTTLVAVSGITMILDSIHLTLYGYLRAIGRLHYEAIGMIMSQFITLVLGTIFLLGHAPLISLIFAFTIASAINVLFSYHCARKKGLILVKPETSRKLKKILLTALPFTLAIAFGRFYSYADIVILKIIRGSAEVGIYSTPSKISFAFQFIPLAFTAALYPRLSELAKNNPEQFKKSLTQSIGYLLLIAAPISFGIFILAKPIVLLAFTEKFIESVLPLKIMILSLIFSFVSFPLGAALNACGQEKKQTVVTAIALIINVIANALLIPTLGAVGAAWSALLGNCVLGVLGFFFLPAQYRASLAIIGKTSVKLTVAIISMCLLILYTQAIWGITILSIFAGGVAYTGVALAIGLIGRQDIMYLRTMFRRAEMPGPTDVISQ